MDGLISSFSSHGLSPDLQLKPDVAAPGAFIYSTIPLENGGFAVYSGTSMASPHVVGAVALLLEARPDTPSQAVRDLTIENRTEREMTLDLTHLPALATSGVINLDYLTADSTVTFEPTTLTVPPSGTVTVTVTIQAPAAPEGVQYGGYLVLTDRNDGRSDGVPYAGFVGDYQSIRVLSYTAQGYPWLAKWINGRFYNRRFGAAFTLQNYDWPYFLIHLDHQVRKLRLEVFDAVTGKSWHRAHDFQYITRNSNHTTYWVFGWDGTTSLGNSTVEVPNGTYRVRLAIQKALGEDDNPDHWEYWDSPNVTIVRPDPVEGQEPDSRAESVDLAAPQQVSSNRTE